jgi:hypothetical protein
MKQFAQKRLLIGMELMGGIPLSTENFDVESQKISMIMKSNVDYELFSRRMIFLLTTSDDGSSKMHTS